MQAELPSYQANMCSIFNNAAIVQARQFSGCAELELIKLPDDYSLGSVVSRRMVLVVIFADDVQITVRMLYNASEADRLRRVKFARLSDLGYLDASVTLDFMKELANQTCGCIARIFQLNQVILGISIPLSMHGFYERYTDYASQQGALHKFGHAWCIKGDFGSLVCTAQVEVTNPALVANLQFLEEPPLNNEELEFL